VKHTDRDGNEKDLSDPEGVEEFDPFGVGKSTGGIVTVGFTHG